MVEHLAARDLARYSIYGSAAGRIRAAVPAIQRKPKRPLDELFRTSSRERTSVVRRVDARLLATSGAGVDQRYDGQFVEGSRSSAERVKQRPLTMLQITSTLTVRVMPYPTRWVGNAKWSGLYKLRPSPPKLP